VVLARAFAFAWAFIHALDERECRTHLAPIRSNREANMTEIQPDGYLALPKSRAGAGVLVLHAWWGLNAFFQDLCKRLVREGLVAFAPDPLSRSRCQRH
jgi:hypothetical protein